MVLTHLDLLGGVVLLKQLPAPFPPFSLCQPRAHEELEGNQSLGGARRGSGRRSG